MLNKKCVSIICKMLGDISCYFVIELFDSKGNLLTRKHAYSERPTRFFVSENNNYKIRATAYDIYGCISPRSISRWLDETRCYKGVQYFVFGNNNTQGSKNLWEFSLADANYENLPIPKGTLYIANRPICIHNCKCCCYLSPGCYDVAANVHGYDGAINPTSFTATQESGSQDFTISATGTLEIDIEKLDAEPNENLSSISEKISARTSEKLSLKLNEKSNANALKSDNRGTFIRCNATGDITYAPVKKVDSLGKCVFDNVPYDSEGLSSEIYVKQLTSDDEHAIYPGVIAIKMTSKKEKIKVKNKKASPQTFTLYDANYHNLPISGKLLFEDSLG